MEPRAPRTRAVWRSRVLGLIYPALLVLFVLWRFREGAALDVVYSYGDIGSEFAPLRMAAASLLRQGELLSWAPQVLGGYPAGANPHAGVFYPLNWLLALLLPPWGVVNYFTVVSFALAAVGTYAFLRDLDVHRLAATLGGVVYALNGNRLFESYVYIGSVAFFPLLLLSLRRGVIGGQIRHFALAGLWSGLAWIAGNPQMGYILNGAALIYALAELVLRRRDPDRPEWKRVAACLAGTFVVGLGLSAAQFLPTRELARMTPRATSAWELMVEGSLDLQGLGRVLTVPGVEYLGVLPVALALAGAALLRRRREALVFAALGLFFLLLCFGKYNPLYRVFFELVPGFDTFRIPFRYFVVVTFAVAVLGALAVDALLAWGRRQRRLGTRDAAVIAAIAAAAAVVADYARQPRYHYEPAAAVSPASLLAAQEGLVELERRARGYRILPLAARTTIHSPFDQKLRDLHASAPLLSRADSLDGYMPLHYLPYMNVFVSLYPWTGPAKDRMLDFLNARYVVTDAPYPPGFDPGSLAYERTTPDGLRVFRNPDPLPRAVLVPEAVPGDDRAVWLARLASGEWDPRRTAQVPAGTVLDLGCGVPRSGAARPVAWSATRLAVEVETTCPALLWILETEYPGWSATVDGAGAPIVPTNLMYRGVRVPAGRHRVEMRYAPASRRLGMVVSLAALALVAAGALWRR